MVRVPSNCRTRAWIAGSPWPRMPAAGTAAGSKPRPLSATSRTTRSPRWVRVSWAVRAPECSRTLARAPCAIRSSADSTRAGGLVQAPSTRQRTVSSSVDSRAASSRSAAGREPPSFRSAGARSWTKRRASARLCSAMPAAARRWLRAVAGSVSQIRSAAWNSIRWLDSPCARVSWMSMASRWRSASMPSRRSVAARSRRVRTRSSIRARCRGPAGPCGRRPRSPARPRRAGRSAGWGPHRTRGAAG